MSALQETQGKEGFIVTRFINQCGFFLVKGTPNTIHRKVKNNFKWIVFVEYC